MELVVLLDKFETKEQALDMSQSLLLQAYPDIDLDKTLYLYRVVFFDNFYRLIVQDTHGLPLETETIQYYETTDAV